MSRSILSSIAINSVVLRWAVTSAPIQSEICRMSVSNTLSLRRVGLLLRARNGRDSVNGISIGMISVSRSRFNSLGRKLVWFGSPRISP